uniref:Uncharacterized protein n=1 Tax=Daucus carota subsp. sativus TaxID=79200 RepID=A0A164U1A3_DAUCS
MNQAVRSRNAVLKEKDRSHNNCNLVRVLVVIKRKAAKKSGTRACVRNMRGTIII